MKLLAASLVAGLISHGAFALEAQEPPKAGNVEMLTAALNEINRCQVASAVMIRTMTLASVVLQAAPSDDPEGKKKLVAALKEHTQPAIMVLQMGDALEKKLIGNAATVGLDAEKLAETSAKMFKTLDDKMTLQVFGEAVLDPPKLPGILSDIDATALKCSQNLKQVFGAMVVPPDHRPLPSMPEIEQ